MRQEFDFSKSPEQVVNLIRAFTYEPGAWTLWKGDPFKITSARFSDHGFDKPGQIFSTKDKLFVSVNGGAIEVLTVIPAGKKEMSAMEWARGTRLIGGEIFG
jgi:methionyl-tRNA formyltransferase